MGNSTSRVVGCFVPAGHAKDGIDLDFLEPLDEGLGHSFCYVRPVIADSPALTPSNSERFTVDSSTIDSETQSGSFRREMVDEPLAGLNFPRPSKNFPETTFRAISGASVSANVSTARSVNHSALFASDVQEPAASFESTSSFAAIPLQPVPRGSGPLNGFLSGPLERGFASGPLERGGGFMSGPIEKSGFMSGPLDSTDKTNFSAPLVYARRRPGFGRLVRNMSRVGRPMRNVLARTFSRHSVGPGWMQRFFLQPVTQFVWHSKEAKSRSEPPRNYVEAGPSEVEYSNTRNLQWAHGKAGEDRVHVVLSEEQGWLFVGIYDGFSGPDAPDFLMSNLYKAIDKELEGLLWDYEEKTETNPSSSGILENDKIGALSDEPMIIPVETLNAKKNMDKTVVDEGLQKSTDFQVETEEIIEERDKVADTTKSVETGEIVEERDKVVDVTELQVNSKSDQEPNLGVNVDTAEPSGISKNVAFNVSSKNLGGPGRKSKRLYELLQMEDKEINGSFVSDIVNQKTPWNLRPALEDLCSRETIPSAQAPSCSTSKGTGFMREDEGSAEEELKHHTPSSFSVPGHKQIKTSLVGAKLRKMYKKQKSLRKKLFPWSYDWHRNRNLTGERIMDFLGPIRRCKSGPVDHAAVLEAMTRALEMTEEAYMDMVEQALDRNPELALMGSCVLVMLMKDQDVYVMNLGDSRVVLAQERPNTNSSTSKDDARSRNRSRESLVRVELDRISEESPIHNQTTVMCKKNKNREISICRLKMRAIQLSTDHSTSIEECDYGLKFLKHRRSNPVTLSSLSNATGSF
ncbi:protein phosphatase 2C 32-like isoform X2 [Aristolochia californica]|uniref:protein phosphatase 2C 32-like isoform X2 n=1 Tax=Aristolochia californica TaxID=171875 RepID=UPI0035E3155C